MLACTIGNIDIVKLILQNKNVDINLGDKCNITPLYVATYYNNLEIVKLLINSGAKYTK